MKKLLLIALCPVVLLACNKNESISGTTKVISSPVVLDTFTLTYNGTTYADSANRLSLSVYIQRQSSRSLFTLFANASSFFPISMEMTNIPGPLNSVGVYKVAPADSFVQGQYYFDDFSEGSSTNYLIDSVMVNITYASIDTVLGSYIIWLRTGMAAKPTSGVIRCYHAQIE